MKKLLTVVLVLLLASSVFAGGNRNQSGLTIRPGVLMVGMEIGYPPMEYLAEDGVTPIGFDVELAKALGQKLGLTVEFVDTAWDGIFAAVDTRRFDCIISSVTITDERLVAHNFTMPYIQNTLAIVVPKNSSRNVRSPQDLAGLNVAFQDETTSDFFMQDLVAGGLRANLFEYEKVINCFDELQIGRVDAIMTDLLVAYEYIARSDDLEIVWQGGDEEFGICLRKGNDALTNALNNALDELFDEGYMLRLSRQIFGGLDLVSAVRRR